MFVGWSFYLTMVCTFGSGKMACIARILNVGSSEEKSSEEATNERIAFQTIYKQLFDADEPNLLEEEDMLVFDSRPLTDPLHLVCCNACKKPVKASHIAAHAERCRSISFKEDDALELDAGTNRKVPPKKGRKKNQATNGREKQKREPAGRDNVAPTELKLENQNGMVHSASGDARRMAVSDDIGTRTVASTIRNKGTNYSGMAVSDDPGTRTVASTIRNKDIPGPLATKMYYSHGSHRLRTALGHLYQQSSAREDGKGSTFGEMNHDRTI